jgi:transposase-like protein
MLAKLFSGRNGHLEHGAAASENVVPALCVPEVVSSEVVPKKRRRHTASYKLSIIAEADACQERGDIVALLRREGLYHSDLANFRKQKAHGLLEGRKLSGKKDPALVEAVSQQLSLERENRTLRRQLARAQQIIDIQKKAALLLGETLQDMSLDDLDENE